MIIAFSIFCAGLLTMLIGLLGLCLMRKILPEVMFPAKQPKWLVVLSWAYLTFALSAWIGFFQHREPMALLAAGMCSLAAVKFLFVYFSYPDFRPIGLALWGNFRALTVILVSSLFVGGLMMYVPRLI